MRLLLVKTSSLGDVIHNLPVLSDLRVVFPDAQIDWCVEEAFVEIVRLHPAVAEIIPVALRRWRKTLGRRATWQEIVAFKKRLSATPYDAILDTQGLIKSGVIARLANGRRYGYAAEVAREALAARCYDEGFVIPPNAHAIERNRWLAAAAFNYPLDLPLDYGIVAPASDLPWLPPTTRVAVLLTATSRDDKLWEEARWVALAQALAERGVTSVFPSGSLRERERVVRLAAAVPGAIVAPPLGLSALAGLLGQAQVVVGVDTGLVHLACALNRPSLALYTATDPALTGVYGRGFCRNLGAPGRSPAWREVFAVVDQVLS